eukprot:TRINITY_DN60924_c0_g1_i1.p2 TRINITY_DN60924_c0_g1~~TRINITY_DN60924_c0_g1_i1.p2  ORF type:complete len:246 (+),score=21.87 TRINITY_DN60924_c0_g1_i1:130-867(+)
MRVLGLTGGIACGKSTVSRHLASEASVVVDCDGIVREVQSLGSPVLEDIFSRWPSTRAHDGTIDREALGAIIFTDARQRAALNEMMAVPLFVSIIRHLAKAWWQTPADGIVVFDVPLLFESKKFLPLCDVVVVVSAPPDLQVARLVERDSARRGRGSDAVDAARHRVTSQMPVSEKARRADVVIDNSGTVDDLALPLVSAITTAKTAPLGRRIRARAVLLVYISGAVVMHGVRSLRRALWPRRGR